MVIAAAVDVYVYDLILFDCLGGWLWAISLWFALEDCCCFILLIAFFAVCTLDVLPLGWCLWVCVLSCCFTFFIGFIFVVLCVLRTLWFLVTFVWFVCYFAGIMRYDCLIVCYAACFDVVWFGYRLWIWFVLIMRLVWLCGYLRDFAFVGYLCLVVCCLLTPC